jgi:hypothetical protein
VDHLTGRLRRQKTLRQAQALVQRIDIVDIARILYKAGRLFMWAFVGLWAAVAVWASINQPRSAAEQQRLRIEALADENRTICGRWGFGQNTHEFNLCVLDLDEVRQNERERMTTVGF